MCANWFKPPDPAPMPALPPVVPTPAAPTAQTGAPAVRQDDASGVNRGPDPVVKGVDQAGIASNKTKLRQAASSMTSWLNTNKTGGMGLTSPAPTKKTLLGGNATQLGA